MPLVDPHHSWVARALYQRECQKLCHDFWWWVDGWMDGWMGIVSAIIINDPIYNCPSSTPIKTAYYYYYYYDAIVLGTADPRRRIKKTASIALT